VRTALTIAGSDSGAGAGIQADLKTFAALGVYGLCAITSVTAQNTLGLQAAHHLPAELVGQQVDSVATDIGVDAVKTGMLPSREIIRVVAAKVEEHHLPHLVVDPVMLAQDGTPLMTVDARSALVEHLLPLAEVLTPNIPEAEELTGIRIQGLEDMRRAAPALLRMGPRSVVVKGGHLEGESVDLLFDGGAFREYSAPRVETPNTHGTGCTFASAIAAGLAKGMDLPQAVGEAKGYLTAALKAGAGLRLGQGRGPLHHLAELYERAGITI
jgi:hydroxymethylpyrimidine/phosphomethylpyrimidine kinase